MPAALDVAEWHAGIHGKPVGPLKRSELVERVQKGDISADTYLWREGMSGWKPLPEIIELRGLLDEQPSLLPPPSMPAQAKTQGVVRPRPSAVALPKPAKPEAPPPKSVAAALPVVAPAVAPTPTPAPAVAPAPAVEQKKPSPQNQTPTQGARDLAASFGLDIDSSRLPQIHERDEKGPESAPASFTLSTSKPALVTEAPIPDIAMPSSSVATPTRRPSIFSVRPSYESVVAELKRRRKHPWAVPFAVATALGLGLTFGFVLFGGQETKIIKQVIEVPVPSSTDAQAQASADTAVDPAAEASTDAVADAAVNAATVKKAGRATETSGTKAAEPTPTQISKGLKGLSGLDGLGGPNAGPSTNTGASNGQPLEASQIQSTVTQYQSGVKRGCWQPALMSRDKDAPSTARVSVSIGVAADGRVTSATTSGDPKGYPGLASCITGRVRGWRFPASGGSTTVNVPFVFAAQ